MYVTRGNYGTIHVAVRSSLFSPNAAGNAVSADVPAQQQFETASATTELHANTAANASQAQPNATTKRQNIMKLATPPVSFMEEKKEDPMMKSTTAFLGTTNLVTPHEEQQVSGVKRKVIDDPESLCSLQNITASMMPVTELSSDSTEWKKSIQRDLIVRGPSRVAEDLTEVLAAYGLAVFPTTKRVKF